MPKWTIQTVDGELVELDALQKIVAAAPVDPGEVLGIQYYDLATARWRFWDGALWNRLLHEGDGHTHVRADILDLFPLLKADISDLEMISTIPGSLRIPLAYDEEDEASPFPGQIDPDWIPTAQFGPSGGSIVRAGDEDGLLAISFMPTLVQGVVADVSATPGADKIVRADGAGKIAVGWLPALENSALADMAQATIKGRQAGAGTGDPQDLTAAQVETILGIQTTSAADKIPKADASGDIALDWITHGAAHSILRTPTPAGTPSWLTLTADSILARTSAIGTTLQALGAPDNSLLLKKGGSDPLDFQTVGASRWVGRLASGVLTQQTFANLLVEMMAVLAGTSFPGSPIDGQPFYRTDHGLAYHYDTTAAGWLSDSLWHFEFGHNADVAATNYVKISEITASAAFSTTIGWAVEFPFKVVGMSVNMAASGTCDLQVGTASGGITGATLSLSAVQSKADNAMMSNAVAAGSPTILSVAVVSGTLEGPARGKFAIRRFET